MATAIKWSPLLFRVSFLCFSLVGSLARSYRRTSPTPLSLPGRHFVPTLCHPLSLHAHPLRVSRLQRRAHRPAFCGHPMALGTRHRGVLSTTCMAALQVLRPAFPWLAEQEVGKIMYFGGGELEKRTTRIFCVLMV